MYAMAQWTHPQTRDGRLAVFIVLPTGTIDRDDGIKVELATSDKLQLSFSWSPALLDADSIMRAILSFTEEIRDGQGPFMAQGLRDYTDPLHSQVGEEVVPTCTLQLPFPVKPDFHEDVIKFDGSDTTNIYVLRFQGFEQRFATSKKRFTVRNIKLYDGDKPICTVDNGGCSDTVSSSKVEENKAVSNITS